jgi:hypothetical protein
MKKKPQVEFKSIEGRESITNDLLFWVTLIFLLSSIAVVGVKLLATEENCFLWKFSCQAPIDKKSNKQYGEPNEERDPPQIGTPQNQTINNGNK